MCEDSGKKKKPAVIFAAVAVVAKLNTLLTLPPLINKTLECISRRGLGASIPACITLSLNALWTLCICSDTTNTRTLLFSPRHFLASRIPPRARVPPVFMLLLKHSLVISPAALQDTRHTRCAHKHAAANENRGPGFNA